MNGDSAAPPLSGVSPSNVTEEGDLLDRVCSGVRASSAALVEAAVEAAVAAAAAEEADAAVEGSCTSSIHTRAAALLSLRTTTSSRQRHAAAAAAAAAVAVGARLGERVGDGAGMKGAAAPSTEETVCSDADRTRSPGCTSHSTGSGSRRKNR